MDTPSADFKNKYPNIYNYSHSSRGFAGRINTGYLWNQGSLNYGVELGYATYANSKYSVTNKDDTRTLKYSGNNIDLLGVIQYNFTPNWNIFAKVSLAYKPAFKIIIKSSQQLPLAQTMSLPFSINTIY
ncbi:hypothetical protein PsalN5692_01910 [Piscirickettsia salmonis]|uniref:outer membrane protein n=1 Tax=Piscirickettsia salmonis TaxID=1238 RepID=UPI001E568700|nr:hypothetical protein [Piscirickettsia salmonis]QGP50445.1 hypothetical protein PsalN5692_01910 [Piscirickettsia salmonis]QGP54342.1 hypothetical protein PsalSR1_01774 [Piscirickettsia salmonis]QGP59762.1 hypothetical protein PsalBI1_02359 [Piscirickettsia salmonis]QGP64464.1 hypothetical protein PsalMR5_02339 [Piscirickettsia salmonis]